MHIRTISKPAPAFNIEQGLFIINGVIGVISSLLGVGNSAVILFNNLANLVKPQA
jgi:hypothetical protein